MTSQWYLFSYIVAVIAAAAVLAAFRASSWYLHVTGAAVGMVAGLMPPVGESADVFYLLAGTTFFFFTTWGIGGLFVWRRKNALSGRVPGDGLRRETRLMRSATSPDWSQSDRPV